MHPKSTSAGVDSCKGREAGPDATALGWGLVFSGRLGLGARDFMIWNTSAGNGWGSNIVTDIGAGSAAVLTPEGTLDRLFSWNVSVGGSHYLSEVLALNASLAWSALEDSEFKADDSKQEGGTVHGSVIWSPSKSVNTGVEYMYGLLRNYGGAEGSANRVQAMIKYMF